MRVEIDRAPHMFIALARMVGGVPTNTLVEAMREPLHNEDTDTIETMNEWLAKFSAPSKVTDSWYEVLSDVVEEAAIEMREKKRVHTLQQAAEALGYKLVKL